MATVREARHAVDARRMAALGTSPPGTAPTREQQLLMVSGLDIDIDELVSYANELAADLLNVGRAQHRAPQSLLAGAIIDGVITGVMKERL